MTNLIKRRINAKSKGTRRELELIKEFVKKVPACNKVVRSAASLGTFDIYAFFHSKVFCIQVKSNNLPNIEEEYKLALSADTFNTDIYVCCCIVVRDNCFSNPKYLIRKYYGTYLKGSGRYINCVDIEGSSLSKLVARYL